MAGYCQGLLKYQIWTCFDHIPTTLGAVDVQRWHHTCVNTNDILTCGMVFLQNIKYIIIFYILQLYTVELCLTATLLLLQPLYSGHFILIRMVNLILSRRIRSRGMHVRFHPFRNRWSSQTAWWRTRATIWRRSFQSITKKSVHDGLSSKGKISKPALN